MPIIGTAGHVDHGKSTLVKALTGRDPDRLAEEKERGLTIDLGFAWTELGGVDVGFVDVPGHERFIKNMLAGVGGIDCALLVVAADSGWMPQTEEHASVLHLLDTDIGVIALTRIDLVDRDILELATLEVMEEIEGTTLEGWPIVPVSPVSGHGMEDLRAELAAAIARCPQRPNGPLRMWVDRSFIISGAGVVVTGTISSGKIADGDTVAVLPGGTTDKVRGLHHHDQPVDHAVAGSRTAINLQNSKLAAVPRGVLVCEPYSIDVTARVLALLEPSRSFDQIPRKGAFHVHIGTASSPASIRRLHRSETYLLRLTHELPMAVGDRLILRDTGRQTVVGGGRVLDPQPAEHTSAGHIKILVDSVGGSPTEMADALLSVRGVAELDALVRSTGGVEPASTIRAGGLILSKDAAEGICRQAVEIVSEYHAAHALRPGISKPELATLVGVPVAALEATIEWTDELAESAGAIHAADFAADLSPEQESAWEHVRDSLEVTFDVPRMDAIELTNDEVHALVRRGDLVQVARDLVFTSNQINEIQKRLIDLPNGFTVSQFKESFGMSRRQAVPTLEWLDKTGWTRRSGDGRSVRQRE